MFYCGLFIHFCLRYAHRQFETTGCNIYRMIEKEKPKVECIRNEKYLLRDNNETKGIM